MSEDAGGAPAPVSTPEQVSPELAADVEAHIAECDWCQRRFELKHDIDQDVSKHAADSAGLRT